jgi:hypothetical protein
MEVVMTDEDMAVSNPKLKALRLHQQTDSRASCHRVSIDY